MKCIEHIGQRKAKIFYTLAKHLFCNFFPPTSLNPVKKYIESMKRWFNNSISKDSISYQVLKAI